MGCLEKNNGRYCINIFVVAFLTMQGPLLKVTGCRECGLKSIFSKHGRFCLNRKIHSNIHNSLIKLQIVSVQKCTNFLMHENMNYFSSCFCESCSEVLESPFWSVFVFALYPFTSYTRSLFHCFPSGCKTLIVDVCNTCSST